MLTVIIAAIKIIFILGFLVLIHEGAHFTVAKLCKIKVNEFAIGFGPTIWKKQGKETKYALRLIPLGGFVSLEGEDGKSQEQGSFAKASVLKRIAVVAAGGLMNILFALIVYFVLMASLGNNVSTTIDKVIEGTQAKAVGIQENDMIKVVEGKEVHCKSDLDNILNDFSGEQISITIERNGVPIDFTFEPMRENDKTYLGVYLKKAEQSLSHNLYYAFYDTKYFVLSIADNLKLLFTGNVSINQFTGPVGIGEAIAKTSDWIDFIYLLALISLSLGVTNLLPFPPLDGGKIVFLLLEAIRRKPFKANVEMTIQTIGFMVLIGLSIYVTYNDILRIF